MPQSLALSDDRRQSERTRFVLIGGFLGAGKTTLIGQLARRYVDDGKSVGIITNDQAANLVDTKNLRSLGFQVGEVDGACFCCSFDQLVETAGKLGKNGATETRRLPDVLLAEPVGSCTDLVATVILPLQQLYGERFDLAPFGVLMKPSHGKRILSTKRAESPSGFSPQAEYIFRKQLEEADYVMIGRGDQLTEAEINTLTSDLAQAAGEIPIVVVSPKTGRGVDQVQACIDSATTPRRRRLQIDYDTYADGEAQLGWVNVSARLCPSRPLPLDSCSKSLVHRIGEAIAAANRSGDSPQDQRFEIAHLKASVSSDQAQSIANQVASFAEVEWGLQSAAETTETAHVIINARVAMDPAELETICRSQLARVADEHGCQLEQLKAHSLRPGRPQPTHRVTSG